MQKYIKEANVSQEERNKLQLAKLAVLAGYQTDMSSGDIYMYVGQSLNQETKSNPPVVRIKKGKMYNAEFLQSLINVCKAEKIDVSTYLKGFSTETGINAFYFNVVNDLIYKNHIQRNNNLEELNKTKQNIIDGAIRSFANYGGYAGLSQEGIRAVCNEVLEEWEEITTKVENKQIKTMLSDNQGDREV